MWTTLGSSLGLGFRAGSAVRSLPRARATLRPLHTTLRIYQGQSGQPVKGATDIAHSTFISTASPTSDFNPDQTPSAGTTTSSPWQGYLSPTNSHLLKLILPLPSSTPAKEGSGAKPRPTAFLLHPSQPLSHLSRLITGSLPLKFRDCELEYLALTGQEDDLDTHLRNAEEEEQGKETERQDGGPRLGERERSKGRFQEVSWSQATDLADFVKQSCLNEKFKILITPQSSSSNEGKAESENGGMTLEVLIPSFASRTTYLRKRLLDVTKSLDQMTKQKKQIDLTAHKGAQRLFVAGLSVGAAYWVAVIRWTFFTDAGWDIMEPVTWATGFGALLASCSFLVYHNREVSYSSLLDLSVSARQQRLYDQHGLKMEEWTEMVAEAKTLRKEITRIAADYDIEWKGELEDLANDSRPLSKRVADHERSSNKSLRDSDNAGAKVSNKREGDNKEKGKIDIDKTIDEASELAEQSSHQKAKEQAAQRKGETVEGEDDDGRGVGKKERSKGAERGAERGRGVVEENQKMLEK